MEFWNLIGFFLGLIIFMVALVCFLWAVLLKEVKSSLVLMTSSVGMIIGFIMVAGFSWAIYSAPATVTSCIVIDSNGTYGDIVADHNGRDILEFDVDNTPY